MEHLVHIAQNSSDDQEILKNATACAEEVQIEVDKLVKFIKQNSLSKQDDSKLINDFQFTLNRVGRILFKHLFKVRV